MQKRTLYLAVLPGVIVLLLSVGKTPGMISDSVQYCAAAATFVRTGHLTTPLASSFAQQFDDGGYLIPAHPPLMWPPGYPLALAAVARLGSLSVLPAAVVVNLVSLTLLLATVAWAVKQEADAVTSAATTSVLGVLPPVQNIFRMALSEPMFLVLCAVALAALAYWLADPPRRVRWCWIAALAIGGAIHVRYTGVLLVPVHAAAAAWVLIGDGSARRRWKPVVLSVLAGPALGSIFVVYRLRVFACALCEQRPLSTQPLMTNGRDLLSALARQLPAVYDLVPGPLDTVVSLLLLGVVFLVFRRRRELRTRRNGQPYGLLIAILFSGVYAAGLIVLRTRVEFDALDETRFSVPIAFPLLVVALGAGFRAIEPAARMPVAIAWMILFGATDVFTGHSRPWRGLTDSAGRQNGLVRYAADHLAHRPGVPLFSPDAALIAAQLDLEAPVFWMPPTGVPRLHADERGVVVIRATRGSAQDSPVRQIDTRARRIAEGEDFIAWELSGP